MPNPFGGFGLPRYVKRVVNGQTVYDPYGGYGYTDGSEYSYYDQSAAVDGAAGAEAHAEEAVPAEEKNTTEQA
jgi:hypothetical protein